MWVANAVDHHDGSIEAMAEIRIQWTAKMGSLKLSGKLLRTNNMTPLHHRNKSPFFSDISSSRRSAEAETLGDEPPSVSLGNVAKYFWSEPFGFEVVTGIQQQQHTYSSSKTRKLTSYLHIRHLKT
jgi:hypothetical protein